MLGTRALARIAALSLVLGAPLGAQGVIKVALSGAEEVPPVATPGSGSATITVNAATGAVSVDGTYTGLLASAVAAHVHDAPPGVAGGIVFALGVSGGTSGTFSGSSNLSSGELDLLLNGGMYVNVHSGAFPNGEIRGQIVAVPDTTPYGTGAPASSLQVVSGEPAIGTTLVLGVTNPTGSQAAGSIPFVAISAAPDPLFAATGTGTPLPGFGMSGPTGELLVSITPADLLLVVSGGPWGGVGSVAPVNVPIPSLSSIVGVTVFAQGALFDPSGPPTIALTRGLEIYFGI